MLPRIYLRRQEIAFWQDGRVFVFEDGELREDFLEIAVLTELEDAPVRNQVPHFTHEFLPRSLSISACHRDQESDVDPHSAK